MVFRRVRDAKKADFTGLIYFITTPQKCKQLIQHFRIIFPRFSGYSAM